MRASSSPWLPIALGLGLLASSCTRATIASDSVVASRATVVRTAVATGVVETERETQVNTQLSGYVRKLHVKLGQKVAAGDPLAEVWPSLTERDLLGAERSLQSARENEQAATEFVQGEHLLAYMTRFLQGERNLERMQQAAERGRRGAEEQMKLLREGKVEIDGRLIDFVVRAPVAGHVLQLAREGDPVTPASSYGIGTVVAVLGDLDQPVFRGAVDEIDVGRLQSGMPAAVTLGPLPDLRLEGTVAEIGLRGRRSDSSTTFDLRIALKPSTEVPMRSGYSAVATVEIARAEMVVTVPERVLRWSDGKAYVLLPDNNGGAVETEVEIGLSDGMVAEVRRGLTEGQRVRERSGALR